MYVKRDDDWLLEYAPVILPLLVYESGVDGSGRSITESWTATGFVALVNQKCWIFTAGHNVEDIVTARRSGTLRAVHAAHLNNDGGHAEPVNIRINPTQVVILGNVEHPPDLGAIPLDDETALELIAGRISPVPEGVWDTIPAEFDYYRLLGTPAEFARVTNKSGKVNDVVTIARTVMALERIASPIDDHADRFWGKLYPGDGNSTDPARLLKHIVGVSGGPILA